MENGKRRRTMLPRVTILVSISTETAQETYTIHSLINDLAKCFAGEFYYKLEDNYYDVDVHSSNITFSNNKIFIEIYDK